MSAITLRHHRWPLAILAIVVAIVAAALWPVSTRQGVDFVVNTRPLPLYVKVLEFVDRDASYRALVAQVTADATGEESRARALLSWTRDNIRPMPPGFPVIDDHVWHIIVRGYGTDEQRDDVFTTLTTYAGIPGYWFVLRQAGRRLTVSAVKIRGAWRLFDVSRGLVFRDADNDLATLDAIAQRPALVATAAAGLMHNDRPYAAYFGDFRPPAPPSPLRGELQMPGPRLVFEARRAVGLGRRPQSERP